MTTDWTSIRLRRVTLERLQSFIGGLVMAADNGQLVAPERYDRPFTTDDAIRILLERHGAKLQRSSKSRKSRAKAKADEDMIDLGMHS